jgi:hypothetical protein
VLSEALEGSSCRVFINVRNESLGELYRKLLKQWIVS